GVPSAAPGARARRLSRGRAAVADPRVAAVLSRAHRRRDHGGGVGARGGARPVTVVTSARPARGLGALSWAAVGLAVLIALVVPPVRRFWHESGLAWPYLVAVGFAAAFFAVPLVRVAALWRGVIDQPSARKVHTVSTPLLGGLAVYFGF